MQKAVIVAIVALCMAYLVSAVPAPGEYQLVQAYPVAQERGDGWGEAAGGYGGGWGWTPKVKYLKLAIPIPQLPRIRFGLKGGLKAHLQILPNHGWSR